MSMVTFAGVGFADTGSDYSQWMANLPDDQKNRPINRLKIPGTHNSGADRVDLWRPIVPYLAIKVSSYAGAVFPWIGKMVKDWVITQGNPISMQLQNGVRSFDLRISYNRRSGEFYITHTYTCITLQRALNDFLLFLANHPGEVLIIQMKPDFRDWEDMTPERNKQVVQQVQKMLGDYLCPKTPDGAFNDTMTLTAMVKDNRRVVLYYDGTLREDYNFLWPTGGLNIPWTNTSDIGRKMKALESDLNRMTDSPKRLNGLGFVLTPQEEDITHDIIQRFRHPCSYKPRSIYTLTEKVHAKTPEFIEKHAAVIAKKASILVTDFPALDFVEQVIALNSHQFEIVDPQHEVEGAV